VLDPRHRSTSMHRRSVPRSLWLGVLELRWVRVERASERLEASRFDSIIGSFGWLVDYVGDRNAANGCETAVSSDPSHCGGCNTVCSTLNVATAVCVNGVCNPACKPGNAHCKGTTNTGCETSILSDISTCVGEGRPCTAWLILWCNRSMNAAWCDGRQLWRLLACMLEQQRHSFVFGRSVLGTMPQRILGLQQQQGHRWMRVEYSQRLVELRIVWIAMQHQPRDTIVHRRSVPRNVPDRLGKL